MYLMFVKAENGNYEGEASQVLILLSNYYADKNYLMKYRWIWKYLDFKDATIISKL